MKSTENVKAMNMDVLKRDSLRFCQNPEVKKCTCYFQVFQIVTEKIRSFVDVYQQKSETRDYYFSDSCPNAFSFDLRVRKYCVSIQYRVNHQVQSRVETTSAS